jgi:hypothetical protein
MENLCRDFLRSKKTCVAFKIPMILRGHTFRFGITFFRRERARGEDQTRTKQLFQSVSSSYFIVHAIITMPKITRFDPTKKGSLYLNTKLVKKKRVAKRLNTKYRFDPNLALQTLKNICKFVGCSTYSC